MDAANRGQQTTIFVRYCLKKITALALAATVASANVGLAASAATATTFADSDINSWGLHINPAYSYSSTSVGVTTYGGRYWACMTKRDGDCPVNNVSISGEYLSTVKVYEVGKDKARFLKPTQVSGSDITYFTVKLNHEGGSIATNQGEIMIDTLWKDFEI